ncbi:MAG: LacI family DNA-binding transcriptional regulator [Sphingobium sp.]
MARAQRRSGQAITLATVAERAGVSPMTVSNVINGTKKMREDTRLAVMAAIEELGYVPNTAARALASARQTTVGIVYRNAQNAFLSAMLVGTLNAAARLGAQVVVAKCDSFDFEDASAAIASLIRAGSNAILLAPPYSEIISGTAFVRGLTVPVSAIAHGAPLPDMDTIGVNEVAAARDMTEHLIDRGHRRIGFITGPDGHASSTSRLRGFRSALAAHGIEVDEALVRHGDFTFESGLAAAVALLDLAHRPTAIFASNDDMAAAVSLVAHRRGLRVPEDLAIAGFDDAPIAVKIWPPLSTVRQEIEEMADRATEMLVARHRGEGTVGEPVAERIGYRVIAREST